jgi:hypothetical protein
MSKQTAVEWLIEQIVNHNGVNSKTFEKAKAMEREQIEQAYTQAMFALAVGMADPEKYYNETYKGGEQ